MSGGEQTHIVGALGGEAEFAAGDSVGAYGTGQEISHQLFTGALIGAAQLGRALLHAGQGGVFHGFLGDGKLALPGHVFDDALIAFLVTGGRIGAVLAHGLVVTQVGEGAVLLHGMGGGLLLGDLGIQHTVFPQLSLLQDHGFDGSLGQTESGVGHVAALRENDVRHYSVSPP